MPGDGLDEVRVDGREPRAAHHAGPCSRPPRAAARPSRPRGLVKTLPKVRTPWGWVRAAVGAELREPGGDRPAVAGAQREAHRGHHLARRRPPSAGSPAPGPRARPAAARPAEQTTAHRSTWASSPAWAPAFMATAPPAVPGMLAPHSRPSRPCGGGALHRARQRRAAPAPQVRRRAPRSRSGAPRGAAPGRGSRRRTPAGSTRGRRRPRASPRRAAQASAADDRRGTSRPARAGRRCRRRGSSSAGRAGASRSSSGRAGAVVRDPHRRTVFPGGPPTPAPAG